MEPAIRTDADRDTGFARWITEVPGAEKIRTCIHCGICSGNCPLSQYMDKSPRRILHLAREGFKEDVLTSFTIWLCTSCFACTVKCPREIKVTDVLYALKRRAIEEKYYPGRFPIPVLAREFRKMILRRGRITEGRLVLTLMLKTSMGRLFRSRKLGWRLWRTGRMPLRAESVRNPGDVRKLLAAVESEKEVVA